MRDRMTTRQAQVLTLRNSGLTYDEIARALQISVSGVLQHLRRARRRPIEHRTRILLATVVHELEPRTRCPRCGLSQPHECLDLQWLVTARRGQL